MLTKIQQLQIENDELRFELHRHFENTEELKNQINETERAKESYKNKMMLLKHEKSKLKEEFLEVASEKIIDFLRKKTKSNKNSHVK